MFPIASSVLLLLFLLQKKNLPTKFGHLYSLQDLSNTLNDLYTEEGVSGILNWCRSGEKSRYNPEDLVKASITIKDKGIASSILNALIGDSCLQDNNNNNNNETSAADFALQLFHAYDSFSTRLKPNIVTLSLVYTATLENYPEIANQLLRRPKQQLVEKKVDPFLFSDTKGSYPIEVLYEIPDFLIVNKPSGITVSSSTTTTTTTGESLQTTFNKSKRRRNYQDQPTLEQILLQQEATNEFSCLNPDGSRGIVHRLDQGTSGCLVIAKTNDMHAKLISQFFLRRVKKSYIALVYTSDGSQTIPDEGTIDLQIDGRPAQSSFAVLERYGNVAAKLRVTTNQGRKHQVRIHCSKGLKAPILLDPLYGGEAIMYHLDSSLLLAKQYRASNRFCLHAECLSIPDLGIQEIKAQLPPWWEKVLDDAIFQTT